MTRQQIEYISNQQDFEAKTEFTNSSRTPPPRLRLFVPTFVLVLLIGLVINYARPAIYQSGATLLTSAATAIDRNSKEVDFQNVAIQRQTLLSYELLAETLERLKAQSDDKPGMSELTVDDIRSMLTVLPVEQTNLLTMQAQGPDPEILPLVVNNWIDVYLAAREASVADSARNTVDRVKNQLTELDIKVESAQLELDRFRKENDISSTTREENAVLSKLNGLNRALNDANEAEVKAKARLDAVNRAIAAGQTVVPETEQRTLSNLEKRHQELKEKLAEFDKRYTREYLALQPSLKSLPEQIRQLEQEIKEKRREGTSVVWTEASQEYDAARQVVADIKRQLHEHKSIAADFTTLFARHQKLIDDLASLEELQRETRDRLVQIESKQYEKYPQVDVVERAVVNRQAVSPDYNLGALIALLTALFFGFFAIWVSEFLTRERHEPSQFIFPVQAWFGHAEQKERLDVRGQTAIEEQTRSELPQMPHYRKLSIEQVGTLLRHADRDTGLLIRLLLSGLTLDEILGLAPDNFDLEYGEVTVDGESPRIVKIGKVVGDELTSLHDADSIWQNRPQLYIDDARAMLYCAAIDAGLGQADSMARALRETYIIFLVEQGLRLASLIKIVGNLTPQELAGFGEFSPSGEGLGEDSVELIHPLCNE